MSQFEIKVKSAKIERELKRLEKKVLNRVPLMRSIANVMHASVIENFMQQGRPAKWQPLKKATIKARAKKGKAGKILQVSGRLIGSINMKYDNNSAVVGTNIKYARIHQFGGTIDHPGGTKYKIVGPGRAVFVKNKNKRYTGITKPHPIPIPARPFLKLVPKDMEGIGQLILKNLLD